MIALVASGVPLVVAVACVLLAVCFGALLVVTRFFRGAQVDEFFDGHAPGYSDPGVQGRRH